MREITQILKAYNTAVGAGKKAALATVVKVEGSSYRQPGARMLVTEDGQLTGAISGGCLEGDALRKALLCIDQKQNKLITYDTSNEDDVEFGVQLGCNGIVHILFEYIDDTLTNNPIQLLNELEINREDAVVITLFSLDRKVAQPGTLLVFKDGTGSFGNNQDSHLPNEANEVLLSKSSLIKTTEYNGLHYESLIEYIAPPINLVIAGAGNDVKPLVELASLLGWDITVCDGRVTHATKQRFPKATNVSVVKPHELLNNVVVDQQTCFVLMTHNYKYDIALLQLLLEKDCAYIGMLGPKTKLARMLDELKNEGIDVMHSLNNVYGPVGLDIGAENSEEIALSIIAEIKAIMSGRRGGSLKEKSGKIHPNSVE